MPELKTRPEFIKALPKKFPGIDKLYKLRDCTKKELIEGYKTGKFPDRVKRASVIKKERSRSRSESNTKTTTNTSSAGFDSSIFENNPAFPRNSNMTKGHVSSNVNRTSSEPAKLNSNQTIELECESNRTRQITPDELKDITGMDINELNEINRKQQEEQAILKMQKIIVDEMNRLREMESLCSQAIEASIKLRNSAQELKTTARLGEHKEYAEVCENIAYVFGNRLASARMIHMDLCIRRDIPVQKVTYQPDDSTIDMVRMLNKIRRKYDFTNDRSINSRYKKKEDKSFNDDTSNRSSAENNNNNNNKKYKNRQTHGGVTVEDVTDSMPSAAI
jgi:hypothetical protein